MAVQCIGIGGMRLTFVFKDDAMELVGMYDRCDMVAWRYIFLGQSNVMILGCDDFGARTLEPRWG